MKGKRVLLFKPDPKVDGILRREFQEEGVAVDEVSDENRAVQRCLENDYRLVIANVDSPVLRTLPFLQRIKIRRPDLHIIVLSPFPSLQNQATALRCGADAFLKKPFDHTTLRNVVERWIN